MKLKNRLDILHKVEKFFSHYIFATPKHYIIFASTYLFLYHLTLVVDRFPQGRTEVFNESLWSLFMVIFVVSPVYIKKIHDGFEEKNEMNLTGMQRKIIIFLFLAAYVISFSLMIYDMNFAPEVGSWMTTYGKRAAFLHYVLQFVFGIPLLTYVIILSTKVLFRVHCLAQHFGRIKNEEEFFREIKSIKFSIESLDRILLIIFILVSVYALTVIVVALSIIDVVTYIMIGGVFLPFVFLALFITIKVRDYLRNNLVTMMTGLLLSETSSRLDVMRRNFILSVTTDENSPLFLQLRNREFVLKNFSVVMAELFLLVLRFVLDLNGI